MVEQAQRWGLAEERYGRMVQRWPVLSVGAALRSKFGVLADYPAQEFERLLSLLEWLAANPASNLYVRQVPVQGLDTKWIEQRAGVVTSLVRALWPEREGTSLHEVCGFRKPPYRVRVRMLCPLLRERVGGLCDIEAPIDELARLPIEPEAVVIVENRETGLALPDISGAVAIMGLGHAASVLGALTWTQTGKTAVYWGDIDTHGYAILSKARRILPGLRSVLMDEATLLSARSLWGHEPMQCADVDTEYLLDDERATYEGLRSQAWGVNVRLEQERLPWGVSVRAVKEACR